MPAIKAIEPRLEVEDVQRSASFYAAGHCDGQLPNR